MNRKRESLQSKIDRLRKSFCTELPARLDEIDNDLNRLMLHPDDSGVQKELHLKLHNIKGTAASFGMKELSSVAIKAESLLKRILDNNVTVDNKVLDTIRCVLLQLSECKHVCLSDMSELINEQTFPAFEIPAEKITGEERHKQLIYICDDDESLLENLNIQLNCFAYSIESFSSPEGLFSAAKKHPPDAIIMDILFPDEEESGFECIQKIQTLHDHHVPVIFISGRDDFQARLYAVQAGGAAYFTKPFKIMELVDALDGIIHPPPPAPYRILIIDDDKKIAEYHSLILQNAGMTVHTIFSAQTILDVIFDFKPDLMLIDMYMPICNGKELAQLIRQIPEFMSLPIVYLSSETDAKKQFSAIKVGADGFLTKPIQQDRLISEVLLRTERMAVMRSLMLQDSLTGLFNHTTILNLLDTAISSAQRRNEIVSFAMIDIDHFKKVNDLYGHPVGDQVLLALSRILKQRLRQSDFVGRYGGEEFAIVLPKVDLADGETIINGLRAAFQKVVFNSGNAEFSCTFSGGVVSFPNFNCAFELVKNADSALYEAKSKGRNRISTIVKKRDPL